MPKRSPVGRSERTPAKHEVLQKIVGRITGAAPHVKSRRLGFIDLCAGDGVTPEDTDFWHGCSPGILIRYASGAIRRGMAPSIVILYEINRNTYDRLITNLTANLGEPFAAKDGQTRYDYTTDAGVAVRVFAFRGSGKDADVSWIHRDDCMFVNNDPNSIHDWAMRATLISEILERTWRCTTFSTMGCNTGGLMMKPFEERKTMWYPHLSAIKDSLPNHMDVVLAAIDRDASKWAYATTSPMVWRQKTEKDITSAFKKIGRDMHVAWWRDAPAAFGELEDRLFLRKTELEERQEGLW